MRSRCCQQMLVIDDGYNVCTNCGAVERISLDPNTCAYNHTPRHTIIKPYSRKSRFFKKCLALLRCLVNCKIDEKLFLFLKKQHIKTPEDLFTQISKYSTKKRRPYDSIMFYWVALGFSQPQCTERDIEILKRDFDNIFFAWHRLGFKKPRFPYSYLFRRIVQSGGEKYSDGMHMLTRFVRTLCCATRKKRYDAIYEKCALSDYKDMHTPIPEFLPKQTVIYEKIRCPRKLDVRNIPNVYQSEQEVSDAIKNDNFNVAKLFHMTKNGNLFVLSQDVSMSTLQLQHKKKMELEQAQKLDKLLLAQHSK